MTVTCRWTFRSRDLAPRFSVMPTLKSKGELVVAPIYSIVSLFPFYLHAQRIHIRFAFNSHGDEGDKKLKVEFSYFSFPSLCDNPKSMSLQEMDAETFKDFTRHEWHIGVVSHKNMN